jgi:hypothetical protein
VGFGDIPLLALEGDEIIGTRQRFPVLADDLGLVVEGIDLARRTRAKNHHDILGAWREVRSARSVRLGRVDHRADGFDVAESATALRLREQTVSRKHLRQRDTADSGRHVAEKATAVEEVLTGYWV